VFGLRPPRDPPTALACRVGQDGIVDSERAAAMSNPGTSTGGCRVCTPCKRQRRDASSTQDEIDVSTVLFRALGEVGYDGWDACTLANAACTCRALRDAISPAVIASRGLRCLRANVRLKACKALGQLGEHARPHLAALAARLKDTSARVRAAACRALGALGERATPHLEALAACLKDEDTEVRVAACRALGALGKHATPQLEALAACLKDEGFL